MTLNEAAVKLSEKISHLKGVVSIGITDTEIIIYVEKSKPRQIGFLDIYEGFKINIVKTGKIRPCSKSIDVIS